jgi:hypothetical protein
MLLPKRDAPITLKLLPILPIVRSESDELMVTKSKTELLDPNRARPKRVTQLPSRPKLRRLKLLEIPMQS